MAVNPFKPGSGQKPPLLAGRERAKEDINELLQVLSEPSGVPRDIVLYGPRGNGKTVLLGWLEEYCDTGPEYTVLRIEPSSSTSLKDQLMGMLGTTSAQLTTEGSGSLDVKVAKVGGKRSVVQSSQAEPLVNYLIRQARKNPLVLLIDEAHTMPPEWGKELLNISQAVRNKAPFLLLLAGTPGLKNHLRTINTTFWNRAKKIPLGRLAVQAATEAIVEPLRTEGITLDPDVQARVVSESQCYPFFIQLWGAALWRAAKNADWTQVNWSLLAEPWRDFNDEKNLFYEDYYNELLAQETVPAALSVANAFNDRQALSNNELHNIVADRRVDYAPPAEVLATIKTLNDLGYIWQGSGSSDWQPGIPSLMTHVQTEALREKPDEGGGFSLGA